MDKLPLTPGITSEAHSVISSILSIAYPLAPVAPHSAGGAEQILGLLDAELTRHGHHSSVVARYDSEVTGCLFPTPVPNCTYTDQVRDATTRAHQVAIHRALAQGPVDLVHMHGIDFDRYQLPRGLPVVVTLHLPPSWYPRHVWNLPDRFHLVCVSESQRQSCRAFTARPLTVIPNGVPGPPPSASPAKRGDYALMLSRICPEKNLHAGLDAARLAGIPALLAGEAYPYDAHLDYLHTDITPRLGPNAQLLPPVGGEAKQRLLAEARCLLLPTLAPETSSLVAMEALHAGTPVIAFPSGALSEIVDHGRTGFLVRDTAAMAAAIAHVDQIDPAVCRAIAAERFSLSRMSSQYLALYGTVFGYHRDTSEPISTTICEAH